MAPPPAARGRRPRARHGRPAADPAVGIGTNIEASLLSASILLGFGIPNVWAKAISNPHGRILEQLGVHHVVYPEFEMGKGVAHLVAGSILDSIQFEDDFAMVRTIPPAETIGKRIGDTGIRGKYGITMVAVHTPGQGFTYATADTVVQPNDTILVSGRTANTERFSRVR